MTRDPTAWGWLKRNKKSKQIKKQEPAENIHTQAYTSLQKNSLANFTDELISI